MRTIATVVTAMALVVVSPAFAHADSLEAASSLGNVLGSEKGCDLKINQKAVEAWIEKNVRANDMEFTGMLNLMTMGTTQQVKDMSAAQKAAHCTQVRRVARANKFISE